MRNLIKASLILGGFIGLTSVLIMRTVNRSINNLQKELDNLKYDDDFMDMY